METTLKKESALDSHARHTIDTSRSPRSLKPPFTRCTAHTHKADPCWSARAPRSIICSGISHALHHGVNAGSSAPASLHRRTCFLIRSRIPYYCCSAKKCVVRVGLLLTGGSAKWTKRVSRGKIKAAPLHRSRHSTAHHRRCTLHLSEFCPPPLPTAHGGKEKKTSCIAAVGIRRDVTPFFLFKPTSRLRCTTD